MKRLIFGVLVIFCSVLTVSAGSHAAITPETALQAYLHNGDTSFKWEVKEKKQGDGVTLYRLEYTSQIWRTITWKHEMFIMVPEILKYNDALLFITGGHNDNTVPSTHKWDEDLVTNLSQLAKTNMSVVSLIWQVPNQPLYGDRTEDALISFTLHSYLQDHDFSWPLLFPMTKSAVRAMDVVQKFSKKEMKKILTEIQDGTFARQWIRETRTGKKQYNALLNKDLKHPIEKVGRALRARMPWLETGR